MMKAIGVAAQDIAREIGDKNVAVEQIGLERDKVNTAADGRRHLISALAVYFVLLVMLAFAAYALTRGAEGAALAADVVKFGIGALIGGFGGWGLRGSKKRDK